MRFKPRNLRAIAEMIVGDDRRFIYRSSSYITRFMEECDLDYVHRGETRWSWTNDVLAELLQEAQPAPNCLPDRFVNVLRVLMDRRDAEDVDLARTIALEALNGPLGREG